MNRRQVLKKSALVGLGVLGAPMINLGRCQLAAEPAVEVSTKAIDLVSEATVVDMQLTYNERNRLGSGCYVRRDRGLTAFGAEVVAEMNRVGMAIDVSHCGERTTLDAIAASRTPVLVTHSNCEALVPGHPRCKSDEVIRRMAAAGGVIGITVVRSFVGRSSTPSLDDLLDHFDHVVGVEYVGLGSDVDLDALDPATGGPRPYYVIRGLHVASRAYQLAEGLLERGYGKGDVELVLGANFRRALFNVWYDSSDKGVPERERRRDPFCPAPRPVGAGEASG